MEKATRKNLAKVAEKAAQIPFHGYIEGEESNLEPIIRFFPQWTLKEADGLWCAAFVYYCCREAGFEIPIRPEACKTCHLAGCIAWEEFAMGDPRIAYHQGSQGFVPEAGDIVLYDRVFENKEHDHIGIVLENRGDTILAAEGNIHNKSGIIERPKDEHIRGYIRIPDGYVYRRMMMDYQTENLILHFVTEDDISEVARTWPADHHPLSDAEAREAIAHMRGNYERNAKGSIYHLCLAVCREDDPRTIMGWCGLDGSRNRAEPEIFILLDEPYRGKGYGTLCVKELLRIAAEDYALSGVHGGCAKENIASARAMEKGGMAQYGAEENGDPLFRFCANNESYQERKPVDDNHAKYMKRCYDLAISAGKKGYDSFGAVLVYNGEILEEAENTADYAHGIFGHAEFNLVHKCANKYSDEILGQAVVYTSCAPCERCLAAIASLGVHQIVCGVSYKEFCKLLPFDYQAVDREGLLRQLGIQMTLTESVLEEEGMHVFEWWGGEYHPLAELIAEMDEVKKKQK